MEKLHVKIILEILGRPAQHIKDTLKALIEERIAKEKGVKLNSYDLKEPLPVQDSKDLFTTFSEVDLEIDSIETLFGIVFAYMPANIEVISPENINLSNNDFNLLTNKLALRIHDYDAITKKILSERDLILRKLQEVAPHLFKREEQVIGPAGISKPSKNKSHKKAKKKSK